ncbi:MAG: MgtC/SapB family protein [Bacilli bacterium]|nr:MgtC/SapB family protein [Bacilli bacterium]MCI7621725.1 MgtC/SapB family protein [Bacilli bacterium]MDY5455465.1 MgtC/SapB family protein [Bacilli bacterium]MDY5937744.1 MgtC/SapB family protein [Bacilli bacterium]MDY6008767.1 MgtC/SapB family protein [Bacilli bacterium]
MDSAILGILDIGEYGLVLYSLIVAIFAILLGGLLGLEREINGHAAGLRTHILITMSGTLVGIIGVTMNENRTFLLLGIVIALGFVSAGSIVQTGKDVRGITTSSTLLLTGVLGFFIGVGYVLEAMVLTLIALGVLVMLHQVETKTSKKNPTITILLDSNVKLGDEIIKVAETFGLKIKNISSKISKYHDQDVLKVVVTFFKAPKDTIIAFKDELQTAIDPLDIKANLNRLSY